MPRKVYRVVPNGDRWELRHQSLPLYSRATKEPVVERGQEIARANQPSKLIVYEADRTLAYEQTYGDDPHLVRDSS